MRNGVRPSKAAEHVISAFERAAVRTTICYNHVEDYFKAYRLPLHGTTVGLRDTQR